MAQILKARVTTDHKSNLPNSRQFRAGDLITVSRSTWRTLGSWQWRTVYDNTDDGRQIGVIPDHHVEIVEPTGVYELECFDGCDHTWRVTWTPEQAADYHTYALRLDCPKCGGKSNTFSDAHMGYYSTPDGAPDPLDDDTPEPAEGS